jgi:hypothetical protein
MLAPWVAAMIVLVLTAREVSPGRAFESMVVCASAVATLVARRGRSE